MLKYRNWDKFTFKTSLIVPVQVLWNGLPVHGPETGGVNLCLSQTLFTSSLNHHKNTKHALKLYIK